MPSLRLPHFRFSLRTLLIVITIPVPFLAWVASVKMAAVQQRTAIAKLQSRNHFVALAAPPSDFVSKLFRRYVDKDAFQTVHRAQLFGLQRSNPLIPLDHEDLIAVSHLNGLCDVQIIQSPRSGIRDLSTATKLSEAEFAFLSRMRSLGRIQADVELTEPALLKLASLPKLISVSLPNSEFSDKVLATFGANPSIKYLEFDASNITAQGLEHLESMPRLRELHLRRIRIDDSLFATISNCNALTFLILCDCDLNHQDAVALNRLQVPFLHLYDCRINEDAINTLQQLTTRKQTIVIRTK